MGDKSKERTTRQIMYAYLTLLTTKPFSSIAVHDICEEALVHRSTFYRYYVDKYDLFNSVIGHIANTLYERASSRKSNRTLFEELIDYIDENRPLFLNMITNIQNSALYSELVKVGSNILHENSQTMEDALSVKIRNSESPKIVCDFYSSGIIGVTNQWIQNNYKYSNEKLVEIMNELLL